MLKHVFSFAAALQCTSTMYSALAFTAPTSPIRSLQFTIAESSLSLHRPATKLHLGDFFNSNKGDSSKDTASSTPTVEDSEPGNQRFDDDDPVEKLFGFFFGKKEEAPMGMARFGKERFPEQYPAVKDEWAEPVESDDAQMKIIRPFLKNTNLEERGLKLSYDANRDGWDPITFHQKCDKLGGAVVLCESRMGVVCGGYNPKGWVGYGEARGSIAAFLFVVGGKFAAAGAPGTKLQKVGGPGLAQIDNPENGPSFGADSLVIPMSQVSCIM